MVRAARVVGHVPRRISSICSVFLRRGGSITCTVTGSRHYSGDLPQGGLELPCTLKFEGREKEITKVKKLIKLMLSSVPSKVETKDEPSKSELTKDDLQSGYEKPPEPKKKKPFYVTEQECREIETSITKGDLLSDIPINLAQNFLQAEFPNIKGLQSTLLQSKKRLSPHTKNQLQIIHSQGNHWIVVSSIDCDGGVVNVYDSMYSELDPDTEKVVFNLFGTVKLNFVNVQKQKGGSDCGLFAIAISTAISNGLNPSRIIFDQAAMRSHLVTCLNNKKMTLFPTISQ